ncbi:MAG: adenylate/guanylate cyclase domain-containing protein [Solirubrobacterales bacterium]|nr:adenylate/guanylate cyclase domain-containing protein [Solirubrobacterales bacterium]
MADFAAEGFLDGLEGDARAQRLELLQWLKAEGFTLERLRRSHHDGLLPFLAAEREVVGDRRLTEAEVAEAAGIDPALMQRLSRALGLPPADPGLPDLTETDLESARLTRQMLDLGVSEDQMLAVARVAGSGLGRLAEVMRAVPLEHVLEPGLTELQLAQRYKAAVGAVMPLVAPMVELMLRQQLDNMVRHEAVEATEMAQGHLPGARDTAVAFADLVGFTRLGEELDPADLGAVADRLSVLAEEVVQPPVRVVKTIGDAVMLACPEPQRLVACSLALVDAIDQEGQAFPQVRVGIAAGPAVTRGGDLFGRPVNLASRVTGVARAGSVLATKDVRDAAREAFQWSRAGVRRLKGLPEPVPLYRARAA